MYLNGILLAALITFTALCATLEWTSILEWRLNNTKFCSLNLWHCIILLYINSKLQDLVLFNLRRIMTNMHITENNVCTAAGNNLDYWSFPAAVHTLFTVVCISVIILNHNIIIMTIKYSYFGHHHIIYYQCKLLFQCPCMALNIVSLSIMHACVLFSLAIMINSIAIIRKTAIDQHLIPVLESDQFHIHILQCRLFNSLLHWHLNIPCQIPIMRMIVCT